MQGSRATPRGMDHELALVGRETSPVDGRVRSPGEGRETAPVEGRVTLPGEGRDVPPVEGRETAPVEGLELTPGEGRETDGLGRLGAARLIDGLRLAEPPRETPPPRPPPPRGPRAEAVSVTSQLTNAMVKMRT